ncbi:hypothetical protein DRN84_03940 [Candidatus Geothermarchaeota archaeon]|nr:MAG: hypothetical protein DRN87_05100 [Candidatus Geothermarchaeota archaeon]RLG61092.1 MAG: hypothetical protein DRN84_03940 [Candidatus Geothermarchaeota archaeon]
MNKDIIKKILEEDELAGDIIRVLALYSNVLWESEIKWEIESMNSTLDVKTDFSKFDEKLDLLSRNGLIVMERRIRGSLSGVNPEEYLIKLVNPSGVVDVLKFDNKIRRYIEARREVYKKYLEKRGLGL